MTKVLFAAHHSGLAGAENALYRLLVSLKGTDIVPLALFPTEGPGVDRCRQAGIDTRISPMTWWTNLGRPGYARKQLAFLSGLDARVERIERIVRDEDVDIVFTNTAVILEGALAALLSGRPHVWHILEMLSRNKDVCALPDLRPLHALMRLVGGHVAVVSNAVLRDYENAVPRKLLRVIHTGIDVAAFHLSHVERGGGEKDLFHDDRPGAKRLLFLGNISVAKGVLDLIRAMNKVWERRGDIRLLLAGREVDVGHDRIVNEVSPRGRPNVVFLGFRKDVPDMLQAVDALVLPSHVDSFPLTVLEGMAAGLPVIGTRSGGMEDQIVDGETGRLVPARDYQALAEAILDVFSDAERAKIMGAAGRQRVKERFYIYRMRQQFLELFSDAIEHPAVVRQSVRENARLFLKAGDILGRQMADCFREIAEERNRYRASYDYFMSRPVIRWARAVKRFLRMGAGKSAEDIEGTTE